MQSTFERVQAIVADVLTLNIKTISPETDLMLDLGPDSLEVVQIIQGLEDEFAITLGDDAEDLGTAQQICDRIDEILLRKGSDLAPMM